MNKMSGSDLKERGKLISNLRADKKINEKFIICDNYAPNIRIKDKDKIIGSHSVHYEVFYSLDFKSVSVEIHFEDGIGHEIIELLKEKQLELPPEVKWSKKTRARKHIVCIGFKDDEYDVTNDININNTKYYEVVISKLILLEDNLGNTIRKAIKNKNAN